MLFRSLETDPQALCVQFDDLVILASDIDDRDRPGIVVQHTSAVTGDFGNVARCERNALAAVSGGNHQRDLVGLDLRLLERFKPCGLGRSLKIGPLIQNVAADYTRLIIDNYGLGGARTNVNAACISICHE